MNRTRLQSTPSSAGAGGCFRIATLLVLAAAMTFASANRADATNAVSDWSARSEVYMTGGPPYLARSRAMVQVAVHDALNAIARRFAPYTDVPAVFDGGSPEAAIATATYDVLINMESLPPAWPALTQAQKDALQGEYDAYMASLVCTGALPPNCVEVGKSAGLAASQAIRSLRTGDGATVPAPAYVTPAAPGVYQPTPNPSGDPQTCVAGPAGAPQFEQWANVAPFSINAAAQFRADAPTMFDLTSDEYARDYEEVQRIGRCDAELTGNRTPDQTLIARYFPAGGGPGSAVARDIIEQNGLDAAYDLWEYAQLFALLNIAQHDAIVTVFDTKYYYRFWRPVTAIRAGDTDGNPATAGDSAWLSYIATPPYPDFTCGLPIGAGASAEVLRRWFGTDFLPYTRRVRSVLPGSTLDIERSYYRLSQATDEAVDARVFGGIHFRTGCVHAVRQGEKVGRYAILHELKRLRPSNSPR
jgi:hypothetical protein